MTRRFLVGAFATLAVLVAYVDGRQDRPVEARCADRLNIAWSESEGATEKLTAFSACVRGGAR